LNCELQKTLVTGGRRRDMNCLSVFWSVNICCRFFAIAFFLFRRIFSEGAAEVFSLFLGGKEMPQLIQAVTILITKRRFGFGSCVHSPSQKGHKLAELSGLPSGKLT